jgi:hypothetical protein
MIGLSAECKGGRLINIWLLWPSTEYSKFKCGEISTLKLTNTQYKHIKTTTQSLRIVVLELNLNRAWGEYHHGRKPVGTKSAIYRLFPHAWSLVKFIFPVSNCYFPSFTYVVDTYSLGVVQLNVTAGSQKRQSTNLYEPEGRDESHFAKL